MNVQKILAVGSALCLLTPTLSAQDTKQVDELRQQLEQMEARFERTEREHRAQLDALRKQIDLLTPKASPAARSPANEERKKLEAELAAELQAAVPPEKKTPPVAASFSASQTLAVFRAGAAYMNVSFDALIDAGGSSATDPSERLQLGDHDPAKRGFSLRNAEIALDGAVDPYFKGFANIVFKLDQDNGTAVELEEVYALSSSLPKNLQLKAGQFFANFGRQNSQHPHQWAFVDQPLILNRAFGPDGLRNVGTQLSWLVPTPFYTELFLGVFDGEGGTAFNFRNPGEDDGNGVNRLHGRASFHRPLRGAGDLLFTPRLVSSFEISDTQTILAGLSGALGPNSSGPHRRTEIFGADLFWKWKPENSHGGFPFVSWQTEALSGRYGLAEDLSGPTRLPAENLRDWGFYSQLLWGFQRGWVAGLRGEHVDGNRGAFDADDVFRGERTRLSPALTWFPSEFSKIRLQYNYDRGEFIGTEHSVWLQLEFSLGAHGAHKF